MRLQLLLIAVVLVACSRSQAERRAPEPALHHVERVVGASRDERLPLVLALHGLGDTPESFVELFDGLDVPVRIIAPRAPDPHSVGSSWFPIDDRTRAPAAIYDRADKLARLLTRTARVRPTQGRPIVTGFSQGGILTFALAAQHSDALAAAIPIAGLLPDQGPPIRKPRDGFRLVALHGTDDARIAYRDGVKAVKRLREAGMQVELIDFPGVGHSIPEPMHRRYLAALREAIQAAR
jgi:phospholipase/carboxylesterase